MWEDPREKAQWALKILQPAICVLPSLARCFATRRLILPANKFLSCSRIRRGFLCPSSPSLKPLPVASVSIRPSVVIFNSNTFSRPARYLDHVATRARDAVPVIHRNQDGNFSTSGGVDRRITIERPLISYSSPPFRLMESASGSAVSINRSHS